MYMYKTVGLCNKSILDYIPVSYTRRHLHLGPWNALNKTQNLISLKTKACRVVNIVPYVR